MLSIVELSAHSAPMGQLQHAEEFPVPSTSHLSTYCSSNAPSAEAAR